MDNIDNENIQVNTKKDIFDIIMDCKLFDGKLNILRKIYYDKKEILLYIFFGALATALNIVVFALIYYTMIKNAYIANAIAWFICVIFAYFTNMKWVFCAPVKSVVEFLKQFFSFGMSRVTTYIVEQVIFCVFDDTLGFNTMFVKIVANIVVIILNYVFSKLIVFRKKGEL